MTRLIVLGGFLGAGKTTALLGLARDLVGKGKRVGIIANDQGQELVDTELYRAAGFDTRDVRGGCFCCRLEDFVAQAQLLVAKTRPDVLLAEPVGSCADLVATVLRPLRQLQRDAFAIAPFVALVDPHRAHAVLGPASRASLSEKVTYIYRLQQMEASAIAISKIDTIAPDDLAKVHALLAQQYPGKPILRFSARTREGFEALGAYLLGTDRIELPASPDIDYAVYAAGEAELAWFDGRCTVTTPTPVDLDDAMLRLADALRAALTANDLPIAHVKLLLRYGPAESAASVVANDTEAPLVRSANASAASMALVVNARVAAAPEELARAVGSCLAAWASDLRATVDSQGQAFFSPAPPVPTWRIPSGKDDGA